MTKHQKRISIPGGEGEQKIPKQLLKETKGN